MSEPQTTSLPTPTTQPIILDTNIIQYSAHKEIGPEILNYLIELTRRQFTLSISNITVFEILSGSTTEQETRLLETLKLFSTYQVTDNVLLVASRISTLYGREKLLSQNISIPDKIITATAIVTNSVVMTADLNDFPRPFLVEVEEKLIYYQQNNKRCIKDIMLLGPNYPFIQESFNNRP